MTRSDQFPEWFYAESGFDESWRGFLEMFIPFNPSGTSRRSAPCQDRAAVGRVGQRLAEYGGSWQDMAAVGRIWRYLARSVGLLEMVVPSHGDIPEVCVPPQPTQRATKGFSGRT